MQQIHEDNKVETVEIPDADDFDPVKTFECGQCFRWNADINGVYTGVAASRAAMVWKEGNSVFIRCSVGDFDRFWRNYFDLDRDYKALRRQMNFGDYLKKAAEFGTGIRILRQDKWEALCSFIISQCNNIPRIKKIIEALAELYGKTLSFEGRTLYSFPEAEDLAALYPFNLAGTVRIQGGIHYRSSKSGQFRAA
jgi:N-glycosylase/DNA lyase